MRHLLAVLLMTLPSVAAEPPTPDKATGPLPPVLIDAKGQKIVTPEAWAARRKAILATVQAEMYGTMPAPMPVKGEVLFEDANALGGKAIVREIKLTFGPKECPPIYLLLTLPKSETTVPIFIGLNFCGNHAVLAEPKIHLPTVWMYPSGKGVKDNTATEEGRGSQTETWPVETIIGRGYGLATFYAGDVDPDRAGVREGVQLHILGKDFQAKLDAPGSVTIWAWGAQRVLDYVLTLKEADPKRIAVVGHSRLGKAALFAGATDERFALVIPHQSGCGGAAPSRGTVGETVKQINDRFPHWFNAKFKSYNDDPSKLPFDQNHVMALVAPRLLLVCNAAGDQWANPSGQFAAVAAAEPAFELLGQGWGDKPSMPAEGELLSANPGYYYREGKHAMTPADWKAFLDYADKNLKAK